MRNVRKIMSMFYLKEAVISWLVLYMALLLPAQIVMAATPVCTDPGSATVVQGVNTTAITVNQSETIMKWSNFNTVNGESVAFQQGSLTNSAVLNRISGGQTQFDGNLTGAGMRIFLLNPAGIVFGSGSSVNVTQLVASSLNITDADFLNGSPYQFTGVQGELANGAVINEGSIQAQRIALIGRDVINRGILMADKSVVMAAGNSVLLSENGGKVTVQVEIGDDWIPNKNYQVINEGKEGIKVNGDDVQIILAAGDIWSSAYIEADGYGTASVAMEAKGDIELQEEVDIVADADSPAVATLDMTAGENITIGDDVGVEAYGYEDNATAVINVDAGGSVYISGCESDAGLYAEAEGIAANTAQITVNAVDDVDLDAEYGGEAYIYTGTYGGKTNNSSVDVTAGGDVRVDAYDDAFAGIEAESYAQPYPEQTVTSTVSTTINAGGKVVARADYDSEVDIDSEAWNGTDNTATTTITAGEYVKAKATDYGDASITAEAHGGTASNKATLDITVTGVEDSENYRNGGVYVIADYDSEADIYALADADIEYPEYSFQVVAKSTSYGPGTAINTANVFVNAAQDVEVTADGEYSDSYLGAEAYDGLTNTATTIVTAGGDVKVQATGWDSDAFLGAETGSDRLHSQTNTAAVTVNAGGNVMVIAGGEGEEDYASAELAAYAEDAYGTVDAPASNTAGVDITANNVVAVAIGDGDARIKARAAHTYMYEEDLPVNMITLQQENGIEPDGTSNTANVTIHTFKIEMEEPQPEPQPEPTIQALSSDLPFDGLDSILSDYVDGGHVAAVALNGGDAQIEAVAFGSNYGESAPINKSNVLICAEGAVISAAVNCQKNDGEEWSNAEISSLAHFGFENNATLGIGAQQGVGALAMGDGTNASLNSTAMNGYTNNADLVACTAGPAAVLAVRDGDASIVTQAFDGYINNASTAVCADSLVVVGGIYDGQAEIASYAGTSADNENEPRLAAAAEIPIDEVPSSSTAKTVVISKNSGVAVAALEEGSAGISATAVNANINDASTGVCAKDHIVVAAGVDEFFNNNDDNIGTLDNGYGGSGGTAYISSEAGYRYTSGWEQGTSDARTTVVSHEGAVMVADMTSYDQVGSAAISSEAYCSETNTAYTGVAAGADLSPASLDDEIVPPAEPANIIEYIEQMYRYELPFNRGEVGVYAEGPGSDARIISEASYGPNNNAQTVVCAPGEVSVESDGWEGSDSIATIKSWARNGEINTATTQIYASEVYVDVDTLRYGNGIGAYGDGGWINIDNNTSYDGYGSGYPSDGGWNWVDGEHEPILFVGEGEGSTLIIDGYGSRQDCPDCPPCPDCPCQDEGVFAPVAPLAKFELPRIEGCPALTQAAALELGIAGETLQVALNNALALNPNIQPCQACSSLVSAATILRDADGSRMAAMAYVFGQVAPADAPFTPEMGAAIATAFSQNAQTDARYASAMEYVDAFVQYVTVVDRDLNAPVDGDAVAFAMNKYGNAMAGSGNSNMAAYIMTQMPQQ